MKNDGPPDADQDEAESQKTVCENENAVSMTTIEHEDISPGKVSRQHGDNIKLIKNIDETEDQARLAW